jgi:hypothetical protein
VLPLGNALGLVAAVWPEGGRRAASVHQTEDLALPAAQLALLEALSATGTPVVVVLVQGRPHALPDLTTTASAVLSAWYPGPRGGRAVADVLFGNCEPRGRLSVSVPRSAAQLPVFYNGKDHRYRGYVDQSALPRHAFGHGLSYTSVEYGPPRLFEPPSRRRRTGSDVPGRRPQHRLATGTRDCAALRPPAVGRHVLGTRP